MLGDGCFDFALAYQHVIGKSVCCLLLAMEAMLMESGDGMMMIMIPPLPQPFTLSAFPSPMMMALASVDQIATTAPT